MTWAWRSTSTGESIPVNPLTSSANAEVECIARAVEEFAKTSSADVLISWKHFYLNSIAQALGAPNARAIYPDER
jgi:hypothetical protein